jgi:hypothetical protein
MAPSRNQFQVDNGHFVEIANQKRIVTSIIQDNVGTLLALNPLYSGLGLLGYATRHKVFVSYHHANDQHYRNKFEQIFTVHQPIMISRSVQIGDIDTYLQTETIRQKIRDEYLRDSTVTVVLIGAETWQRKHVDWEIGSSIRNTTLNSRSGLLGILLPTYRYPQPGHYDPGTIPPRLYDNIKCGYAAIYSWSENPAEVLGWIQEAFYRRSTKEPDNSYESFTYNKSGWRWSL